MFLLESSERARRVANELFAQGLRFKILPEALNWHFAGTWGHILPSLCSYRGKDLNNMWKRSDELLRSAVAIPIFVKMDEQRLNRTIDILLQVLRRL